MAKKFKESRLLDYCKNDVIYKHSDNREGNWSMFFSDHTLLQFNFLSSNFKEQEKDGEEAKLFFVTVDDIERAEREFNVKEDNKLLLSLTHFVEKYPEKRIYLREVRSIRNSEFRRFFSGEVLEIILILLKRQNGRINNEKLIEKYQEKWKSGNCGMHTTIDLEELERVLEEFDIDKSSITIVPDPKFQWQKSRVGESGIDSDFGIIGPNRYRVIDSSDAIFNTFLAAVCDVNWATGHCGSHENCGNISKESIIETINRILIIPQSTLIIDLFIITHLKSLVCLHGKSDESEYDKFMHQNVTLESYVKTAKHYNLQVFLPDRLDIENSEDQSLEWILRVYLLTGWACQFFDGENMKLKRVVLENLSYRIPEKYKTRIQPFLQKMINDDAELISSFERRQKLLKSAEKRNEKLRKRKEDAKKAEKKIDLFRDLDKIEMVPVSKEEIKEIAADAEERRHAMAEYFHSSMSAKTEEEEDIARHRFLDSLGLSAPDDQDAVQEESDLEAKTTHSQKKGDSLKTEKERKDVNQNTEVVPLPKPALTEPTNLQKIEKTESKCCSKCLRTSEMCNEAKKELKMTQNKLEKYEKKAKRTDKAEDENLCTIDEFQKEEEDVAATEEKEDLEVEDVIVLKTEVERLKENAEDLTEVVLNEDAQRANESEDQLKEMLIEQQILKKGLDDAKNVIEEKELEIKIIKDKCKILADQLDEKTKFVAILENQIIDYKEVVKAMGDTVEDMEKERTDLSLKLMLVEENRDSDFKGLEEEKRVLKDQLKEKARKVDDVEKKMKVKDSEMNQIKSELKELKGLKKQSEDQEKWRHKKNGIIERLKSEAEKWKSNISEKEKENVTLKSQLSKSTETNESLVMQLSRVEEEKRKSKIEEREKNESFQNELLRKNEELQTANRRLSILNEEQERRVQNLLDRLAIAPSPEVSIQEEKPESVQSQISAIKNLVDKLSNSEDSEEARQFRITLQRLRNIKDRFQNKDQLKLAKTMTDKLIQMSNRSEIRELALYEYQQYEANFQNYTQLVDLNIEKMKETRDCSLYSPLPKPPAFSDRFMNEYWLECDKEKKELEMDISDSECLICFFEMNSDQKTLKCDHCKKITHLKCASKWLQIHRSCPHCRREQLDPEEFPALS
ncbi:unnamed protein product [Caenorhabditis nigoni]